MTERRTTFCCDDLRQALRDGARPHLIIFDSFPEVGGIPSIGTSVPVAKFCPWCAAPIPPAPAAPDEERRFRRPL